MRMEGENAYFKQTARIGNFKNIAYSVARRHQRLICAYLQGTFFTYDNLHCGPSKLIYNTLHFLVILVKIIKIVHMADVTYIRTCFVYTGMFEL